MKQRLLAGLLAVVLVLGLAPAALAAAPAEEEAAQVLAALDIMVGDESGNLNLGATVTRAEFTKLAVAASTSRDAVGDTVSVKPYPDVPQSHWAAPYIKAAVDRAGAGRSARQLQPRPFHYAGRGRDHRPAPAGLPGQ